jgi:RNA polymerase-binding protein DksA
MSQINIDKMREKILAEKARLEADRAQLKETSSMSEESGDLVDFDANHPADSGTELFERSKDMAFVANIDSQLEQIDHALQKMADGTYGICDNCGEPIPAARLEALPYATLCITCQDLIENPQ